MKTKLNIPAVLKAMENRKMRPVQLARKIGVPRQSVSMWLAGKSMPRGMSLLRLGIVLDLAFCEAVIQTPEPLDPVTESGWIKAVKNAKR